MRKLFGIGNFALPSLIVSVTYLVLSVYSINFDLVKNTLFGNSPFMYKINLLLGLLGGLRTNTTSFGLVILVATSLLVGLNLILLIKKYRFVKNSGNLHLVVGGSSLVSIAGTGCVSCGVPVLGLLGLSGTVSGLPFKGLELSILSLGLLLISLIILVRNINKQYCEIADH